MKYHVIKSQFLHLYFSKSVCFRRKRNIRIASSLQGLLICYGESLSGTLRTIECQKMSEVPKGIESISRYLSFKPIPPMTVSPHAIETINSGNSMEFYGDPVLPWAEGLFQESTLNFEQDHPKKEIASSPIRRMVSFFWNSHLTVMACLAFLIPHLLRWNAHGWSTLFGQGCNGTEGPQCYLFLWQWVLCRVSLLETPPRCVSEVGSCWMPLLHFWWPVGVCNPNVKFIKVLAVLVYETMDLDVAKT